MPTEAIIAVAKQQRIDAMLGIDQNGLKGLRKVQYQKQLEAAFEELRTNLSGREIAALIAAGDVEAVLALAMNTAAILRAIGES